MIAALFSAKGAPGVTSTALALAAVWPRPVVLVEADPAGSDLTYRCRISGGGMPAPSPSLLSLGTAAARPDRQAPLAVWTQQLGCGVNVVLGVTSPAQGRGIEPLWSRISDILRAAELDVLVDAGRLARGAASASLVQVADVRIPVAKASAESVITTRELLRDVAFADGLTIPVVVTSARAGAADAGDLDEILRGAGVFAESSMPMAFDHPGLLALERGASPAGRGRGSLLVRSARRIAERTAGL